MQYRTPLSRARGLGSIQSGTHHWWMQRVTAVALIPLSFFSIGLLDLMINSSYQETVAWLSTPFHSTVIIAWIISVFYHAALGLQVVIEDYIAVEGVKIITVWAVNLFFFLLALAAVIAVLRIITVGGA